MRKLYRLSLRLFFALTCLIMFYLSKKTFEIKDIRTVFPNDPSLLLMERVNNADPGVNQKNENVVDVMRTLYEKKNEDIREKIVVGDKITKLAQNVTVNFVTARHDSQNGRIDSMKQDNQDERKDNSQNESKPTKLPPFISESPDNGPGEHGAAVKLTLNASEEEESKRLFELNKFNQYVSDRISVHRRLDDTRIEGCKNITYPPDLPMTSVIVCFHNEAWSVLLRSVHSIIDRSPPELIREIILVDDLSTMDHLKGPLDQYMGDLKKVKIVRSSKREGLIRARLLGYDAATGPVLVFLDSHIECFPGWLEPMLARIAEDPKAVVFPVIPSINKNTFSAFNMNSTSVGTFKWSGLVYTWTEMSPKEAKRRTRDTDPIRSPTMPGGLFAVDKKWFTTLGTYDQQLDFWGGENIELSFKSWMCNGSIELIPCSQVGHVFRSINPIKWSGDGVMQKNSVRVAEVWMDEYREAFFDFSFSKALYDSGDVSDRKRLRDSLHCHNFKWYLDNVLEITMPTIIARGEIRSESVPQCLDSMENKKNPELYGCHYTGVNQRWVLTQENYVMQGLHKTLCYEGEQLLVNGCSDSNKIWLLNYEKGSVQHSASGLCLELVIPNNLTMAKCSDSKYQRWILPERKPRLRF